MSSDFVDNIQRNNEIDERSKEDHHTIWYNCLKYLRNNIPQQSFDTWFRPINAISMSNGSLYLQVPNKFFYDWIEGHYKELLQAAIKETTGNRLAVRYSVLIEDENINFGIQT